MQDSIFTKIINGEIPSFKIYEDDKTVAFLDIHPIQPGHVLVVPKTQVDEFQDLELEDYDALWRTVRKVARRIKKVVGRSRVGIHVVGLDVPHVHVHVFPFDNIEQYHAVANMSVEPNQVELAEMANRLKF